MNGIFQALYQGFNFMTSLPEHIIEPMEFLPEFLKEALIDSLNLVPFLFVIFTPRHFSPLRIKSLH